MKQDAEAQEEIMSASKVNRKIIWIGSLITVIGLAATLILVGLTRPQSSTLEPEFPALVQAAAQVPESKAFQVAIETARITEYVSGRMVVYVPAGAINTKGTILVINREPDLFPEAGEKGWRRPIIINVEFQDQEGNPVPGLKFTKPIQICASLSDDGWKQYTRIRNDFRIQTYSENGGEPKWEELYPSAYIDRHQICGRTMHLSLFSLAIFGELPPVNTPTPAIYVR